MKDDWILDVLTDLKAFAEGNNLPFLAVRLAETHRLAAIELALRRGETAAEGDTTIRPIPISRRCSGKASGGLDS